MDYPTRLHFQSDAGPGIAFTCSIELGEEARSLLIDKVLTADFGRLEPGATVEECFDLPAIEARALSLFEQTCKAAIQETLNWQFGQALLLSVIEHLEGRDLLKSSTQTEVIHEFQARAAK